MPAPRAPAGDPSTMFGDRGLRAVSAARLRPIRDGPRVLLESLLDLFARACARARGPAVILVTNSDSLSLSFLPSSLCVLLLRRPGPGGYQYLC